MKWIILRRLILINLFLAALSCTNDKLQLGTDKNPIKFYLVPGQDLSILESTSVQLKKYLYNELGLNFEIAIPNNYIALVEAFGSKRADLAIINSYGYILAKKKYNVHARLRVLSDGTNKYFGQIIARTNGPKNINELNGKKFAYVDPASTSGYLLPASLLKKNNIKLNGFIFSGRHDVVVSQVYQQQVDAGATFYMPELQDARKLVKKQYPDVFEKIKIIKTTGPIYNDPVIFRKDFPTDLENKIVLALKKFINSKEGIETLKKLFHVNGFEDATDQDYLPFEKMIKEVNSQN